MTSKRKPAKGGFPEAGLWPGDRASQYIRGKAAVALGLNHQIGANRDISMTAAPPFADAVRSRLIFTKQVRRARTKKPVVTLYQMRKLNGVIMPGRLVDTGGWIIVCDGAKALILENVGDRKFPNLRTREVHQQETPKTQELGTDAPGRAHQSVGAARSSVEQTDWHEQSEQRFLIALAGRLDRAAESGETKALILVAPSRALGVLRKHYTPKLKTVLRGEIERDYVNLPVPEIEARLAA